MFLGRALEGPVAPGGYLISPARFAVLHYDEGSGPATISVATGARVGPEGGTSFSVNDLILPLAGDLWRIYGRPRGGVLVASECSGSHRVARPAPGPRVTLAGRTVRAVAADLAGVPTARAAPVVRVRRPRVRVRVSVGIAYARVLRRGRVASVRWPFAPTRALTVALPPGESRLVVDTGDRPYVVRIRRPRAA